MTPEQLLKALHKRRRRDGVMTADRWMKDVQKCLDGDFCPVNYFSDSNAGDWAKCLKDAEQKLTYTRDDLLIDTKDLDTSSQDDGALMRFNCTLTTRSRDRDGDVLEVSGGTFDKNMPLLWQHIAIQPVGGFAAELEHSSNRYRCSYRVADTALGQDTAALIAVKALRMSHGFEPDFDSIEMLSDGKGYYFPKFKTFEGSVVSIPANAEAFIDAFETFKFHTDLVKSYCKSHWQSRPVQGVGADMEDETSETLETKDAECTDCGNEETTETKMHSMPPLIQNVSGSWEWICTELESKAEDFLNTTGVLNGVEVMEVRLVATWNGKALLCVIGSERPFSEDECYSANWSMADDEPEFSGDVTAVELFAEIRERLHDVSQTKGAETDVEDEVIVTASYTDSERELFANSLKESTDRLRETVSRLERVIKSREPSDSDLILEAMEQFEMVSQ